MLPSTRGRNQSCPLQMHNSRCVFFVALLSCRLKRQARVVISQIFACGFHPPGCWNLKPTVLASSECSQQGNCELNTLSTVLHQWSAMKNMLEQEVTMLNMPRPNMCQPYRPIARRQGLTMYWATTPVYRCERHVKTSNCFRKWEVCNKDLRWVATNSARLACMGQGAWME